MGGVSPKRESAGEYRGGRALRISREVGNPLKARINNESRSRARIESGTLPINPLPGETLVGEKRP